MAAQRRPGAGAGGRTHRVRRATTTRRPSGDQSGWEISAPGIAVISGLGPNIAVSNLTVNSASFGTLYNQGTKTSIVISPYLPLPDNTDVTLRISVGGTIVDLSGNVLAEQDVTFHTGSGPDFTNPSVELANPASNQQIIPTNTVFNYLYSEPLAPYITANPQIANIVYDYATNSYIPANLSLSSDGMTLTLAPALTAGAQYSVCTPNVYDLAGNQGGQACATFTVSSAASGTPQVVYTTPTASSSGVPTNAVLDIGFNEPVDSQSLGQLTLTPTSPAGPAVPINAFLIDNGTVVRLQPAALLAPGTTWQVSIAGVTDLSGANTVLPQSFTFMTGQNPQIGNVTGYTSVQVSLSGGGSTALTPYANPGITNVDGTQPLTLNFSAPIELASIAASGGIRLVTAIGNTPVPFTVVQTNGGSSVVLTPTGGLAAGTQYLLYLNYGGTIVDAAGYGLNNSAYFYFTTH